MLIAPINLIGAYFIDKRPSSGGDIEVDEHYTSKMNLTALLDEIQLVSSDFGLVSLGKTLSRVNNFAAQNRYLDIAVLGQFKAGKSSFLNALIGKPLLPVGSIPVTSIITRISYGPEPGAIITMLDGSTKVINLDEVHLFVSEAENPGNTKNVCVVDIKTPELADLEEVRLVDTPGIGSIWKHNTETTSDWFPETGGVFFIISAEKPISEYEINLLQEISIYTPEISIIITKTDLFQEEQIDQIETFTLRALKEYFGREFAVYRYSAFANTQYFNQEIKQKAMSALLTNREETYNGILKHKIKALTESCLSYLNISYQASLKLESERKQLKDIILDEHLNADYTRKELLLIIGSYKGKTRENIRTYLDSFKLPTQEKLAKDFEQVFPQWQGNLYQLSRQYEKWLKISLETALKEILLTEDKSYELLNAVKKHLAFYLRSFRERLNDNLERVLGVKMNLEEWQINLHEINKPDISVSRSFDFHLDLLWFLFPTIIYRGFFKRHFFKQIPAEVEKNYYRLTSDLNELVNKQMDYLMLQALSYINEELSMIERLLSEFRGDNIYIKDKIDRITGLSKSL
ncbi:hypothetical protein ASZ90_019984 [hydrocarbon metagenome]|uniref:Dynamin N-terminal domain-containing protein n=1 Tax=hydrocarbon metagenome TaxID=938273 RepID=A0A0W8E1T5_9ZZZZ